MVRKAVDDSRARRTRLVTIAVSFLLSLIYIDVLTSTIACSEDSEGGGTGGSLSDAQVDAPHDSDLPDSPSDGETDAPLTDAPLTDAPPDSDLPDSSLIDAPIDATPIDAGIDATPVDAMPVDAMPVDAAFPVDAAPIPVDAPPDA